MRIRLDQIGDQPYAWNQTRKIPPEALEREGLADLSPVVWRGEIRRVVTDAGKRPHRAGTCCS